MDNKVPKYALRLLCQLQVAEQQHNISRQSYVVYTASHEIHFTASGAAFRRRKRIERYQGLHPWHAATVHLAHCLRLDSC